MDEFDRLRDLSRTVSWFRAAGLALVEADVPEIAEFVCRFREGPAAVDDGLGSRLRGELDACGPKAQ